MLSFLCKTWKKKKIISSNKANFIKVWWKCFYWACTALHNIQDGYLCMDLLLWTVFGQHWVGNLSSSFPHSTSASTGNKDQGQPTSQQDLKEISGTLQDYIIMPAQSFSWIHVKFSSWHGASCAFLLEPEEPAVFAGAALHSQAAGLSLHCTALGVTASGTAQPVQLPRSLLCSALLTPAPGTGLQPTRGRIGPPCKTSAYQLVTLTDCIYRESLWKMQSIMWPLLIFCFCCIYSWFMALWGG